MHIAQNPSAEVAGIYKLVSAAGPFQPTVTAVPADWSLNLLPIPAAPVITPASGSYPAGQQITLTDSTADAQIYYTTDGSVPSVGSPVYTAPLVLSTSETLRAIAVAEGVGSTVSSASFTAIPGTASHLVFSTQPANAVVGIVISPAPTVSIVDNAGEPVSGNSSPITLSLGANPGSATLNGTATVTAVNGVATFPGLSITAAANGYTLAATSPGLTMSASTSFDVVLPGITLSLPSSSISVGSTLTGSITL